MESRPVRRSYAIGAIGFLAGEGSYKIGVIVHESGTFARFEFAVFHGTFFLNKRRCENPARKRGRDKPLVTYERKRLERAERRFLI